ncbi:hypothetical protein [Fictibacillus nanhaiensis]|nr:hypothetical protein [Fictibacillus nanhaiensis]
MVKELNLVLGIMYIAAFIIYPNDYFKVFVIALTLAAILLTKKEK